MTPREEDRARRCREAIASLPDPEMEGRTRVRRELMDRRRRRLLRSYSGGIQARSQRLAKAEARVNDLQAEVARWGRVEEALAGELAAAKRQAETASDHLARQIAGHKVERLEESLALVEHGFDHMDAVPVEFSGAVAQEFGRPLRELRPRHALLGSLEELEEARDHLADLHRQEMDSLEAVLGEKVTAAA